MDKLGIVAFAKEVLGKHIFDYEEKRLENYEELMSWSTYNEWIKPPVKNQFIYNIYVAHKEYLKATNVA
ncbi:hypothetical protein MKY96_32800 [Paenibacillus sp. FSL R7-0302]|uniref:hypothetical protein n=1 Tax=Paenibacillus sp. FSL R7-0302 TaxID=2921681 RepID=UPI0030F611FC